MGKRKLARIYDNTMPVFYDFHIIYAHHCGHHPKTKRKTSGAIRFYSAVALGFSLVFFSTIASSSEIDRGWDNACEVYAHLFASSTQARAAFWSKGLEETPPDSPARRLFIENFKKLKEDTDNSAWEGSKKLRENLMTKNWSAAEAKAIALVPEIVNAASWAIAMKEPGLSAESYERRLLRACQSRGSN
jgi:hypothetical protein